MVGLFCRYCEMGSQVCEILASKVLRIGFYYVIACMYRGLIILSANVTQSQSILNVTIADNIQVQTKFNKREEKQSCLLYNVCLDLILITLFIHRQITLQFYTELMAT